MMINYFYKKIFTLKLLIIFSTIVILQLSCTENLIPPEEDETLFSFNVKVVDDNNNPMQGIMIGSYYHTSLPLPKESGYNKLLNPMASTSIRFAFDSECYGELTVYDLENKKVSTIIENQQMYAGQYAVYFDASGIKGGVYKIKLVARSLTNQGILFEDSIYAALLHLDPTYCKMGFTNSSGNFIANDKTYFPSLYTLPDLVRTAEDSPAPLGVFSITDQITIQLTDTLSNITKVFTKTIGKNKNEFVLKFSEGTNAIYKIAGSKSLSPKSYVRSIIPKINLYWSLEQNYPNPFN